MKPLERNEQAEPGFRNWLKDRVNLEGQILFDHAVNAGAEKFGVSQATVIRYIKKMTSSEGEFQLLENAIKYKGEFPGLVAEHSGETS